MKHVLITGAYGGMGRATALRLRDAGFRVVAMDRAVGAPEEHIIPITADVTNEESLLAAFSTIRALTDELYAIVHFAGIYVLDSLLEMDEKDFLRSFDVNVFGAARVNRIFLPLLKAGSRILLTTSELAPLDPLPFTGLYAITKSTLDKYAYSLRMELQLKDISVIVLRPGAVQTGMLSTSTAELDKFCGQTKLYTCNAKRFKRIVESVEARHVPASKVAAAADKILHAKRPRFVYNLNRNPLLILLNLLPRRLQTWIIRLILK